MKLVMSLAVAATLAAPVQASTIADLFSSFWVLGDSLSDNGNTARLLDPGFDPDVRTGPNQPGVFSDGFTWAKGLTDAFAAAGKPTKNLSFAGAWASDNGDFIPDLGAQIDASPFHTGNVTDPSTGAPVIDPTTGSPVTLTLPKFDDFGGGLLGRSAEFGDDPLVAVFIGGNDFLGAAAAIAGGADPATTLATTLTATLASVTQNINALVGAGVNDLIVMNLPDFGNIPRLRGTALADPLTSAASTYNSLLSNYVSGLRANGVTVTEIDIFGDLNRLISDNPDGLANVLDACVRGSTPFDCSGFLFFDDIHPTRNGHAAVEQSVINGLNATYDIAPVPLPAPALMLIGGLGLLAGLRRRDRRAAA